MVLLYNNIYRIATHRNIEEKRVNRMTKKNVSSRTKILLFFAVAPVYCLCSLAVFSHRDLIWLFFIALSFAFEFFINRKFNTPHYIFMLASLAPVVLYMIIFRLDPVINIHATEWSFIFAAIRIFLSLIDFIRTKKYYFIPVSILVPVGLIWFSTIVWDYQFVILREMGFDLHPS